MGLDDAATERQHQAEATALSHGTVRSKERLEHALEVLLRDADAVVPDGDNGRLTVVAHTELDRLGRVFARVFEQVVEQVTVFQSPRRAPVDSRRLRLFPVSSEKPSAMFPVISRKRSGWRIVEASRGRLRSVCAAVTNLAMTRDELLAFLCAQPWAVEASVTAEGEPQAAVIGVAVTSRLELVFDTLVSSRKARNLRANPRVAVVMGWDDGRTAQIEGVADEPVGAELIALKEVYLRRFPDGHERASLPDITYFRLAPKWIRYSDFRTTPPTIVVFDRELGHPHAETLPK